jgi:hypothetical protein
MLTHPERNSNDGPSVMTITSPVPQNVPQHILKRKLKRDNNNNDGDGHPMDPKRMRMTADIQETEV